MKNKIKKFSKGDFRVVRPEIVFPETNLTLTIGEGEIYQGSFTLKDKKNGLIRGLVYTSSYRMKLKSAGFEGNPVEVHFTYDGTGLAPGHVEHGRFTVVCNGGEYDVEFTVIIEKPYVMTAHGRVQNIRDFKKLALQDYSEALRLFRSRDFYEVIKYEEPRIKALYDNMRKWSLGEQAMEEFLVGTKQKECIFLTLGKTQKTFRNLKEATKEVIHFNKNTWGYMPVKVHVEGDFIHITKDFFSTDDFVGNLFDFSYYIHPDKCHAGNNFGRITFESPYESITYEVLVAQHKDHLENHREIDMIFATISKGFLISMSGRKDLAEWADETRQQLSQIDIYTGEGDVYPLIDAHLHILLDNPKKAEEILDKYNYNKFAVGKDPVVSAYYLYLTALVRKSVSYVNRVVEELNKAYMKRPRSWQLVSMLIELDPEYKNYTKRLSVIEYQYNSGANQTLLYWLAFKCFQEHPSSMKKLGAFEIQIMNFAVKYKLMTKDVALYMANLATQQRTYNKMLDRVLRKTYEIFPDPQILTAICTHMIRGNCVAQTDFVWYERAVFEDLKIAQLYEYYMMTMKDTHIKKELPKTVYFYFVRGNTLDYRKAALLYANVIKFLDENSDLYSLYREQMERFAWEQLRLGRINEALRIVYKRCCRERELTPERARDLYNICHTYEVKTSVPDIAYVMVLEADGTISQKVPYNYTEGTTVLLFSKDSRILWESKSGRRYVDSIPYDTLRLFYESRYMDICKKFESATEDIENPPSKGELDWDKLVEFGIEQFSDKEVYRICSMKVREEENEENELLLRLCYDLFEKDMYDKSMLMYLVEHYCGATADMKKLWHAADEYELTSYKLSERIITQMLFSEMMFGEEEIFSDYYDGRTYFRLKQAYLAYVSREYVVRGRQVRGCVFTIIANEYRKEEDLPDICKIALLKYYSQREIHQGLSKMLREFLREMCEKQLFFSFYLNFPESWLREVQLYDKTMIEYHAKPGSKVTISYQIRKDDQESLNYTQEVLLPSYGETYIKTFILFEDENVKYYFTESRDDEEIVTEKRICEPRKVKSIGKYGRLNDMVSRSDEELSDSLKEFAIEKTLAEEIFVAY